MMATHPFRYSVQKPWSHSKILFSLITTHPIQCEILLALPSRYIQAIAHHLHCCHPGPRHHHYSPGYYISLLLVCSFYPCFTLRLMVTFMSLFCSKNCNDSPIFLRVKSKAQTDLQGPVWFGLLSPLWHPSYCSSLGKSAPKHHLLSHFWSLTSPVLL